MEAPRSEQCSTSMAVWGAPDIAYLSQVPGPQVPHWWQVISEPKIVANLPKLGGEHFWQAPPLNTLVSIRPELPPDDLSNFRATAVANKSDPEKPSIPDAISEEVGDFPCTTSEMAASSDFDPNQHGQASEQAITALVRTAQDPDAFPDDRSKAMLFLEDGGVSWETGTPFIQAVYTLSILPIVIFSFVSLARGVWRTLRTSQRVLVSAFHDSVRNLYVKF